jgi:hypothetical protein
MQINVLRNVGIFFIKFLVFLMFCVIGSSAGLRVFSVLSDLEYSGTLVRWQWLESRQKFHQIVNADQKGVWVQADNGKTYIYYSVFCDYVICGKWQESTPPSQIDLLSEHLLRSGCKAAYRYYGKEFDSVEPKYPPETAASPLECTVVEWREPYNGAESLVYYVLVDNGDLWMWNHSPSLRRLFGLFIVCPLIGLILGIIVWFVLQKGFLQFHRTI